MVNTGLVFLQIWSKSLTAFMRYSVHKNGMPWGHSELDLWSTNSKKFFWSLEKWKNNQVVFGHVTTHGHINIYVTFPFLITLFYLSESMCACEWLLPWSQKFKGRFILVPEGSPLLSQTASMCDCVQAMFWMKLYKNASLLVVLWGQKEGSLVFMLHQGFP